MYWIRELTSTLLTKFMENFELLLTAAVFICLIFYIIDGFTYRKQRKRLLTIFQNKTETTEEINAYRDRLQRVKTIPPESVKSKNFVMTMINRFRFGKAIAQHHLKLEILQKLAAREHLNSDQLFWLKEPVYPREKFIEFFSGVFWVLFGVWFFRSFLYEPFRIPSGSMEPTLYAGDFILTNKYDYGVKFPVFNKVILPVDHPQRGDVIVFRYPPNEKINYIKRIVGMPGDKVHFDNGKIWIDDQEQKWLEPVIIDGYKAKLTEDLETYQHGIQIYPNRRNPIRGTVIVPDNRYFVMGDNRDDSEDSRYWGFVPRENIVGKANLIWFNSNCFLAFKDCKHIGKVIR